MIIEFSLIQNFLLALAIVSLVTIVGFVIHAMFKKHKQIIVEEPDLATGYKKILKTANRHAKNILSQTTIEAANILAGSKITNEKIEENLDHVLQGVAADDIHSLKITTAQFEKEYQEILQNIQEQMHQTTQEALQGTQAKYNEQMNKFTNDLLKNGLSTQTEVENKKAELLSKAESDIEEYKKNKIATIEEESKKIIDKVYKDVLRTSIPQNVHKELILKSLEQAKKDGIFKL